MGLVSGDAIADITMQINGVHSFNSALGADFVL